MSKQVTGFCYIDEKVLRTPAEKAEVMLDCWWWEKDGQILDYYMNGLYYAQANKMKSVMDHMVSTGMKAYAGHTPVMIPIAYYRSKR